MLTLSDIENAVFRRAGRAGYNGDDVDAFLTQVRTSYEALIKNNLEQKEKIALLSSENENLKKERDSLSSQVQQYREEEDGIKTALISAQRLGDASIREARHKSEIILKDAELQAQSIVAEATGKIDAYENELEQLKRTVSDFRASLLDMYRKHLVLIDALPSQKSVKKEEPKAVPPQEKEPRPDLQGGLPAADPGVHLPDHGADLRHRLRLQRHRAAPDRQAGPAEPAGRLHFSGGAACRSGGADSGRGRGSGRRL